MQSLIDRHHRRQLRHHRQRGRAVYANLKKGILSLFITLIGEVLVLLARYWATACRGANLVNQHRHGEHFKHKPS
jgi:hypothetical protein